MSTARDSVARVLGLPGQHPGFWTRLCDQSGKTCEVAVTPRGRSAVSRRDTVPQPRESGQTRPNTSR